MTFPKIMGILNVTPDSFSDGGRYLDYDDAIDHALLMTSQGADIIDVGGESTRPGAQRVEASVETARVVNVIGALVSHGVTVSVDTMRAEVAKSAIEAGATIVNDVSGGLADPDMASVVAATGVKWVLMHWRGHSADMQKLAHYDDVVADVKAELEDRVEAALEAGVDASQLVIDPGIGFAKRPEHNWSLSARLHELVALGYPVLFAASRKSYLGKLLADPDGNDRPPAGRDVATAATSLLAFEAGVWGVRVHDVPITHDIRRVWQRTKEAGTSLSIEINEPSYSLELNLPKDYEHT